MRKGTRSRHLAPRGGAGWALGSAGPDRGPPRPPSPGGQDGKRLGAAAGLGGFPRPSAGGAGSSERLTSMGAKGPQAKRAAQCHHTVAWDNRASFPVPSPER